MQPSKRELGWCVFNGERLVCGTAGLLWVWPTAVSLEHLSDGPREEDIPILPEGEACLNTAHPSVVALLLCTCS